MWKNWIQNCVKSKLEPKLIFLKKKKKSKTN
jgi:hypothetical protein